MTPAFDIIVLGAGFTGSALTAHLCAIASPGTRLLLAGNETALGLAYGAAAPTHLLNVTAGRMSMYPDRPDDFVQWLTAHDLAEEQAIQGVPLPERFIPRAIYGRYVQDRLREAIAASPCRVTRQTAQAVALARDGDSWRVTFADGTAATASQVAICLGNQQGALPLPPGAVASGTEARVIADPWRDTRLGDIGPADRVLVIGTGLTMVDFVLQREQDGQTGQTVALSRRGLLPEVHALRAEAGVRVPGIEQPLALSALTRLVRDEITARAAQGGDWRPVVDGLRPDTQRLWLGLSLREQSRFLRHLGAHWGVARHRMPPIAGERLGAMQADGRLTVHAGRVAQLAPTGGRIDATLALRGASAPVHETVDWVVNCTGPGRDPARTGNPFLLALLATGIARSDALRLGLATDANDQVTAVDGAPQPGLYALGPVAMGRLFEIVAVPDLRVQIARVAIQVAQA
ncbi:MAG: FAD/NAD(P)-binding protein [Thermomicrobiales bacterium]|nr:FAD/NAD(P)-binding protein [Thermomicrobiales bacterium]